MFSGRLRKIPKIQSGMNYLRVRSYGDLDVEGAFIRKDFHEAGRLRDCLCDCNLSRGGEKSADEGSFGEHGEKCLLLLCSGEWIMRG